MSETDPARASYGDVAPDEPGDAELISAVRAGDLDAYGTIYARHVAAARRLARQLTSSGDADDLVSEAFAKVLVLLQKGGGPDLAFRAYLLTTVRRVHVDRLRAGARLSPTDDMTQYDPGVPFEDTAVAGFENQAAAKAFAQLPERWQQVLWHTEVEGQKPAEIAPLLGISPNSVSALAYRAREGLRQAFISMHSQDAVDDACAATRANLGAYIRNGLSRRDSTKVEAHLRECRACTAIYLELTEVNSDLGALLAPLLLGGAGVGYLAAAGAGAKAGILVFLGNAKAWVLHNPAGRVAAGVTGVAAAAAVAAAMALTGGHPTTPVADPSTPTSTAPATPGSSPSSAPDSTTPKDTTPGDTDDTDNTGDTGDTGDSPSTTSEPTASEPTGDADDTQSPSDTDDSNDNNDDNDNTPVITTPLAEVTTTPGSSVTIDLTKGVTDPKGRGVWVKSARVSSPAHGTVRKAGTARPVISLGGGRIGAGTAVVARNRPTSVVYTPDAGWRGSDTIAYTLTDGHGTVSGTVKVTTPNTAPTAHDLAITLSGTQTTRTVDVLSHAADANGDRLRLSRFTQPAHGTVTAVGNRLVYTRGSGSATADSFEYTVSDGHGGTATARVRLTLAPLEPTSDASLSLDTHDYGVYWHLRVSAAGIPAGTTATFSYTLTGVEVEMVDGWWESDCGSPVIDGTTVTETCTLDGGTDGQVLHLDFVPSGDWTFRATLTPVGFADPDQQNNEVSANGTWPVSASSSATDSTAAVPSSSSSTDSAASTDSTSASQSDSATSAAASASSSDSATASASPSDSDMADATSASSSDAPSAAPPDPSPSQSAQPTQPTQPSGPSGPSDSTSDDPNPAGRPALTGPSGGSSSGDSGREPGGGPTDDRAR
ncbi:MAG: sigma-70 family RNA polymerase sigma factor [Nocardioides sp.]|uniref:sigma-70 family RNA polymerase sigma factor n=1 Tax=Nocardioides sp. TaxID=35761 RepID=UPI0039E4DF36